MSGKIATLDRVQVMGSIGENRTKKSLLFFKKPNLNLKSVGLVLRAKASTGGNTHLTSGNHFFVGQKQRAVI